MVNLLWKEATPMYFQCQGKDLEDLNLSALFSYLYEQYKLSLRDFGKVLIHKEAIVYRQGILKDFEIHREVFDHLYQVADKLSAMKHLAKYAFEKEATLYNLLKRVEEAEGVMDRMVSLNEKMAGVKFQSEGLIHLKQVVEEVTQHAYFHAMKKDIQSIRQKAKGVQSITLGINLDENLNPTEAILLSLNEETIKYGRTLKKINRIIGENLTILKNLPRQLFAPETMIPQDNLNTLEKLIVPAMKQLIDFFDQFIGRQLDLVGDLLDQLDFYRAGLIYRDLLVSKGFPVCLPEFHESNRGCKIGQVYNMNLAISQTMEGLWQNAGQMTMNQWEMSEDGEIFILTGSNRGGKTTFTQAIGQCFMLAQLGLYIPAASASLPLFDGIYLHFPADEVESLALGRLGEECKRFACLFKQVTNKSLVLMNESFSGTSHLESLTIATETVRALQKVGCTVLFNTHLHELGAKVDELNDRMSGLPQVVSLVAGDTTYHQSFVVTRRAPLGTSYADEIAKRYGVSFQQLISMVQ